ncbi:hypothetical protein [Actinocorallia sp. A-T 12471]|uniref:hypothetical protein n=1 Tax=Actinocorallia sp. A-T 12471 TaxID=3089813 RepID=UPI0039B6EDE8
MAIDGALGAALVDYENGRSLGSLGGGPALDLEVASAHNADVVRAKLRAIQALGLDDVIEDILISLGRQYHLIRLFGAEVGPLFLYVALDRERSNLGLARYGLRQAERHITRS